MFYDVGVMEKLNYKETAEAIEKLPWGNGELQDKAAYALLNEADKIRCGRGSKVTTAEGILMHAPKSISGWCVNTVLTWLYLRKF